MPSKRHTVERLNFCIESDSVDPWFTAEQWEAVEVDELSPVEVRAGWKCYGALDLAQKRDLCAGARVWVDGERLEAEVIAWTPADTVRERGEQDQADYLGWADAGDLVLVPGKIIDFAAPARWVADGNLEALAFDPWRFDLLVADLERIGVATWLANERANGTGLRCVPHSQGFTAGRVAQSKGQGLWMPGSIEAIEEAILKRRLIVQKSAALRSAMMGIRLVRDAADNPRPNKAKSRTRVDAAVALTMAVGLAVAAMPEESATARYYRELLEAKTDGAALSASA